MVDDGEGFKQKTDITFAFRTRGTNGFQNIVCNKYFIVWDKENKNLSHLSALVTRFCQTTYYTQPVQANVSFPDGSVLETRAFRPQTALTRDDFNSTLFESIISKGISPSTGEIATTLQQKTPRPFDISGDTILAQGFRVSQRGYPSLNSILAGIAVGGQNLTFDHFVNNTEAIDTAFRSAQQLFFALVVSSLSDRYISSKASQPAIHTFPSRAINWSLALCALFRHVWD